jgi:hypothetical protein
VSLIQGMSFVITTQWRIFSTGNYYGLINSIERCLTFLGRSTDQRELNWILSVSDCWKLLGLLKLMDRCATDFMKPCLADCKGREKIQI